MRFFRRVPFFLLLLVALANLISVRAATAQEKVYLKAKSLFLSNDTQRFSQNSNFIFSDHYSLKTVVEDNFRIAAKPSDGGIKEIIPSKFQEKYEKWKEELLSTEFGRQQWENYSNNKQFYLTITFGDKEGQGAGTGNYQWNEAGELVGATITLGSKLDRGLPNAVYFPVMNSLASDEPRYKISGSLLAAAKFAHEFGHVNQTAKMQADLFRLQNKLMPVYNEILLKNGYNIRDQNLIDLTKEMGGTPVEIWENREYWGETNAMLFVIDRINKETYNCSVFNKIKRNIAMYAKDYEDRFEQIEDAKNLMSECR